MRTVRRPRDFINFDKEGRSAGRTHVLGKKSYSFEAPPQSLEMMCQFMLQAYLLHPWKVIHAPVFPPSDEFPHCCHAK